MYIEKHELFSGSRADSHLEATFLNACSQSTKPSNTYSRFWTGTSMQLIEPQAGECNNNKKEIYISAAS